MASAHHLHIHNPPPAADLSGDVNNPSCNPTTPGTVTNRSSTADIPGDCDNHNCKHSSAAISIHPSTSELSGEAENLRCNSATARAGRNQSSGANISDDFDKLNCKHAQATVTIQSSASEVSGESDNLCSSSTTAGAGAKDSTTDDLAGDLENLSCNVAANETVENTHSPSTKLYAVASDSIHRVGFKPTTTLSMGDIQFVRRVGSGDIGSVYVAKVKGLPEGECVFAAKVMDKEELASRQKEGRARTEREILEMLDHPFLPTLYAIIESSRWSCLLTEFCPGGDLHVLRQRQPLQRFHEDAVRFYASEVVIALEYLHMMGIVYRDLKPENVLIRSDGHIMLTDFDLSLKSHDSSSSTVQIVVDHEPSSPNINPTDQSSSAMSSCILPNCIVPAVSCLHPKRKRKNKRSTRCGSLEIIAEPIEIRSMSFVGTHEYLAPEIVSGEGHGNAVDWWTLGVFMYEMLYGITPFKGPDHELTLANIVARALDFPKEPIIAEPIKDLIAKLLVKDPTKRLGSTMGATAIKHHPYFNGVNWALLRCVSPPYKPPPTMYKEFVQPCNGTTNTNKVDYY
ncbi:serine/threonine-protein kinase D6PK-like [Prosopis cineraria]|uniref:serine/threonine-protein kinase D6PK-like n=1 Tax=Prosopis cineraria TaxID=364024 RepID=UPI00241071DB|nr:serine/threonine-protein kinase D6PK-like [Prosopis cineraria]